MLLIPLRVVVPNDKLGLTQALPPGWTDRVVTLVQPTPIEGQVLRPTPIWRDQPINPPYLRAAERGVHEVAWAEHGSGESRDEGGRHAVLLRVVAGRGPTDPRGRNAMTRYRLDGSLRNRCRATTASVH